MILYTLFFCYNFYSLPVTFQIDLFFVLNMLFSLHLKCHCGYILKVKNLPYPYGDCDDNNNASVSECRLACVTKAVVEKCGCHDVYMKAMYNATYKYHNITSKY